MTPERSRGNHEAAEDNRNHVHALARHEQAVRDRERRRMAALVGPGHNHSPAFDAPLGSDPRFDHTGFSDGLI